MVENYTLVIYAIIINGKTYIGSTKNIYNRICGHRSSIGKLDYKCLLYKYLTDNNLKLEDTELYILDKVQANDTTRCIVEQYYLNKYKPSFNTAEAYWQPEPYKIDYNKLRCLNKNFKIQFLKEQTMEVYKNNKQFIISYMRISDFDRFRIDENFKSKKNKMINKNKKLFLYDKQSRYKYIDYSNYDGRVEAVVLLNRNKKDCKNTLFNKYKINKNYRLKYIDALEALYDENKKLPDETKFKNYSISPTKNIKKLIKQKYEYSKNLHLNLMIDLILNYGKKTTFIKKRNYCINTPRIQTSYMEKPVVFIGYNVFNAD